MSAKYEITNLSTCTYSLRTFFSGIRIRTYADRIRIFGQSGSGLRQKSSIRISLDWTQWTVNLYRLSEPLYMIDWLQGQFHLTQIACTDDTGSSFFKPLMSPFLRQEEDIFNTIVIYLQLNNSYITSL